MYMQTFKSCFIILTGQPPCSLDGTQHYSFDYAQQVHYPHYAQQVGPLFFKTPRKCQCFGICAEGSGKETIEKNKAHVKVYMYNIKNVHVYRKYCIQAIIHLNCKLGISPVVEDTRITSICKQELKPFFRDKLDILACIVCVLSQAQLLHILFSIHNKIDKTCNIFYSFRNPTFLPGR